MTDFTPARDRTRAGYIVGLRMLADLLVTQPDVPHYDLGSITFALGGTEAEAFAAIERAAAALKAAGVDFQYRADEHSRAIEIELGGLRYGFSRMSDRASEEYRARQSYERNVQLDHEHPAPIRRPTEPSKGGAR